MRSELLLSAGLCCLSAGVADAQISSPAAQADGISTTSSGNTISVNSTGTDTLNHTFQSTITIPTGGVFKLQGARLDTYYSKTTGSTVPSISSAGGCVIMTGTSTTATITATSTLGRYACLENYESVSVTLASPNYQLFLHSTTGVNSTVIPSGSTLSLHSDGTNYYQD